MSGDHVLGINSASHLRSLGYLGLTAPDLAQWRTFAQDVCGFAVSDASQDDRLLLRVDERSWRVSVEPGTGAFAFAGWEVTGPRDLDLLSDHLRRSGYPVLENECAQDRRVAASIRTEDPFGRRMEFYFGAEIAAEPFASPQGHDFVTGPQGLGHIVLEVPDMAEAKRFYLDCLGFQISDRMQVGPVEVLFLHLNRRHHSLALISLDGKVGIRHLMVQAKELDSVGRALDKVLGGAAPLAATLGRHTNDQMVSFYVQTPSACEIEFGWSGLEVDDDTWTVVTHSRPSAWGHQRLIPYQ